MKLFTVGPVQMYARTLQEASKQLPYFRTNEFSQIMKDNERSLKQCLNLHDGSIVTLTGSGSAGMEAVVACSFRKSDRVLIINGGSFGARFVSLCKVYGIPYDTVSLAYGEALTNEHLSAIDGSVYTALLVNIHETSTGQLYDISILSRFVKQYHLYFIVDAISSFLADAYDMDAYGIDCTILSSQKALSLAPGISMVALRNRFYEEMIAPKDDICLYLSIKEHMKNMQRGQTPNTPAVGIILELHDMLSYIEEQSVAHMVAQTRKKAVYFRQKAQQLGLIIPDYPLSNALTPIYFPKGNAEEVYQYLKEHYDIYVTPSGGDLKTKVLRVGHLGDVTLSDYDALCEKIKEIL